MGRESGFTPFHYLSLNCRDITATTLHNELEAIRGLDGIRVIHLEEAASLKRLQCDESITDLMDDLDFATCHWIATAVSDMGLDPQFRRRWTIKLTTSPPTTREAICFLAKQCRHRKIGLDKLETLTLLVRRSYHVMGLGWHPVGGNSEWREAYGELVLAYPFPQADPWKQEFFER